MFSKFLFLVPALCLAAPAIALPDAAAPEKPKKICHSVLLTGSRMPQRYCHTATEWAEIQSGHKTADITDQSNRLGTESRVDNSPTSSVPF
ncbi:hypothetical protein BH10PSE14_BH10PSE14_42620 [soil metagenome]